MAWLQARDKRVTVHYGRLEERREQNALARELRSYLGGLHVKIDTAVYQHLLALAKLHETSTFMVEKAVDVMLAVDMVRMGDRNEYDVAYLLASDGDYTPAAEALKEMGKKLFAASVQPGAELAKAVYMFIPLQKDWLSDCFGE
jgi:uncharacterized LabA/DUF88 family protein